MIVYFMPQVGVSEYHSSAPRSTPTVLCAHGAAIWRQVHAAQGGDTAARRQPCWERLTLPACDLPMSLAAYLQPLSLHFIW